jgi:hypothetical protein
MGRASIARRFIAAIHVEVDSGGTAADRRMICAAFDVLHRARAGQAALQHARK